MGLNQVYIALGNFLTSAALLGVDACPMEGIEPPKYDEILGLNKQGLATVVAATAGYRAATDKYSQAKKESTFLTGPSPGESVRRRL